MASTALLGTLMVPEMSKRGYKNRLSIGPILGVGGLAILIPPSALAVLLGSLAHIDIGKLLIAGVMPGLVLATLYTLYIILSIRLDPDSAPAYDVEKISAKEKLRVTLSQQSSTTTAKIPWRPSTSPIIPPVGLPPRT